MLECFAGDITVAIPGPAAPDSEAEMRTQTSGSLSLDLDAPSAMLKAPHASDVQDSPQASDSHSASSHTQPGSVGAESAGQHESSQFSHLAHGKLQQLVSWLVDKRRSTQLSVTQVPDSTSPSLEQAVESEHTSLAQADAAKHQHAEAGQSQWSETAQPADAETEQAAAADSFKADASKDSEQMLEPLPHAAISSNVEFFLLSAASLLAAWSLTSLLLWCFTTPLSRPTALEALPLLEEEEEAHASPEAAHPVPEDAEEEQGTSLTTRARSVARSMSQAVSGLMTLGSEAHGSEAHKVQEAGWEAESALRGSGMGTSRRSRQPRGRRELAGLGKCPLLPCAFTDAM